tara:strand:- start:262 stop:606 length:345 start_codon:yes stop_codon:yes gene_type:complete
MCFTKKIKREKKRPKINRVYPEPKTPSFTLDEKIQCSGCYNNFKLEDLKINCAGCDKFFHCKIAGTCYGDNCKTELRPGKIHRLSWCINCVPAIPENKIRQSRDDGCICKECYK